MHLKTFRVTSFRRLRDVRVDLDAETTIFVGANNSGKTSATDVFRAFLGPGRGDFQIYDFSAACWAEFDSFDPETDDPETDLPRISLDLWFEVDDANLQRVVDLIPDLDWKDEALGVRLEYAPTDAEELVRGYTEALEARPEATDVESPNWKPWPQSLTDYLSRRISREYSIRYFVLDRRRCDDDLRLEDGYAPAPLIVGQESTARYLDSLIRVDFLDAQRHLTDGDTRGRGEELSKRLGRFYERNLEQHKEDVTALTAVADAEARLNSHFSEVFKETLERVSGLGYPGLADPQLVVKATLDAGTVLNGTARIFYDIPEATAGEGPVSLPDRYNGLGLKNLVYMVVEVLDFYYARTSGEGDWPPVHMVMIEEPETHLHAQLQQVFIRKIREILPTPASGFKTQMVVTTHSAHILYERSFQHVRYFRRGVAPADTRESKVRDLSTLYADEPTTRDFLSQYLKLTHCDLFFADATVLVEGNVERLLLPLIIRKSVPVLQSRRLSILEVGGFHAHRFTTLVEFLGIPTLLITDLDSVFREEGADGASACMTTRAGASTANPALKTWLPKRELIADLLAVTPAEKSSDTGDTHVRVTYQTPVDVRWNDESGRRAGRTFEEAFALQNLAWCQEAGQAGLGLRVKDASQLSLDELHERIYKKVRLFGKTSFALALMGSQEGAWASPAYIVEGLEWLSSVLGTETAPAAEAPIELPVAS